MKIAVKDLRPNPFRDLKHYPTNPDKIDALVASIKDTEFWDNLLGRKSKTHDGAIELAYGVHRLQALKRAGVDEIDIPVRNLSDTDMVKIMAHENQTEWAQSAVNDQETIRAIVLAFGNGKIEMPPVQKGTSRGTIRRAPNFVVQRDGDEDSERQDSSYTAATLAKFLGGEKGGWPESKIEAILATLATIERGLVQTDDLKGLTTHQAAKVAEQTRRVVKETSDEKLAKSVGKRLAEGMRSSTGRRPGVGGKKEDKLNPVTYHSASRIADLMMRDKKVDKLLEREHDRAKKKRHQQDSRQVKNYIDSMSAYRKALETAMDDVELFAPEAVRYVAGRHTELIKLINKFEAALKKAKKAA